MSAPILTREDAKTIVRAIRDAERENRGEVRVHIEKRCRGEPLARAEALFDALGMGETKDATGVLLYVATKDRAAAVFAGPGIHGAKDEAFWQEVIDEVARGFGAGKPAAGLVSAVARIGDLLREHAPGTDETGNELPDQVSTS